MRAVTTMTIRDHPKMEAAPRRHRVIRQEADLHQEAGLLRHRISIHRQPARNHLLQLIGHQARILAEHLRLLRRLRFLLQVPACIGRRLRVEMSMPTRLFRSRCILFLLRRPTSWEAQAPVLDRLRRPQGARGKRMPAMLP